jgi:hypothetical protein
MTPEPQTKTHPHHAPDKQLFNAAGVLCEFLASPEELGDAICLIRGTLSEPGYSEWRAVPRHVSGDPTEQMFGRR